MLLPPDLCQQIVYILQQNKRLTIFRYSKCYSRPLFSFCSQSSYCIAFTIIPRSFFISIKIELHNKKNEKEKERPEQSFLALSALRSSFPYHCCLEACKYNRQTRHGLITPEMDLKVHQNKSPFLFTCSTAVGLLFESRNSPFGIMRTVWYMDDLNKYSQ